MLCLQRVERLTLEGNSFKVPGKGWLFQLGMKREMSCWKSDQTLELMWDCTRTSGSGLCYKLRVFSCTTMTWSLLQALEFLLCSPCFGLGKGGFLLWVPSDAVPVGIQAGWTNFGKTLCLSIPSVRGTQIQWVRKLWWVVWSWGDVGSKWWDTSGTTLQSNSIAQPDHLKRKFKNDIL